MDRAAGDRRVGQAIKARRELATQRVGGRAWLNGTTKQAPLSSEKDAKRAERPNVCPNRGACESPYAAAVRALLEDGPMKGKTVEVEAVEGRPPMTINVPDEKGGACRYCLGELTQEGVVAAYTFLYTV